MQIRIADCWRCSKWESSTCIRFDRIKPRISSLFAPKRSWLLELAGSEVLLRRCSFDVELES